MSVMLVLVMIMLVMGSSAPHYRQRSRYQAGEPHAGTWGAELRLRGGGRTHTTTRTARTASEKTTTTTLAEEAARDPLVVLASLAAVSVAGCRR